ncbi:MAG: DUF4350 domain-containing protein [Pirellulaceae bacterium]|nr:DUF4350 domain-containing protein [Pirellulaceae bacterium]
MSTATADTPTLVAAATRRAPLLVWLAGGLCAALLLVAAGWWLTSPKSETLPVAYGRRRGAEAARSVNGTSVLSELFRQAGHRTSSFNRLSPKLDKTDAIVWFPDDFKPPTKEQREFLEGWLAAEPGRTVIYVGRDYDAAVAYWERYQPVPNSPATPENDELTRQLARAQAAQATRRMQMPPDGYARWFTAERDKPPRAANKLAGPWAEGIDEKKADIRLAGRLDVPVESDVTNVDPPLPTKIEVLLSSAGDPLATRVTDDAWPGSQLIVLGSGAFVLNYPLVNHEHRKLAGKLIAELGPESKRVVFLESGPGGPPILEKEPTADDSSAFAFLRVFPLNAIVVHLTILGVIFCLARSPIFGRPRDLPPEPAADFGKHVSALGELLARSGDRNYAQSRLEQYRGLAKRDSGKSHLKSK